jgi:hypothetical protein
MIIGLQAALRVAEAASSLDSVQHIRPNPFLRGEAPVYVRPENYPVKPRDFGAEDDLGPDEDDALSTIPGWTPEMDCRRADKGGRRKKGAANSGQAKRRGNRGDGTAGEPPGGSRRTSASRADAVQARVPRVQHEDSFDLPMDSLVVA